MQGMMQELGQNFMNNLPGLTSDPRFMASIAMMRGIPYEEAYAKAAEAQYNIQRGEALKLEQQRSKFIMQQMPQLLQQLKGKSPQEIFQALVPLIGEEKAAVFAKNMGAEAPEIEDVWHTNSQSGEEIVGLKENGRFTNFNVVHPGQGGIASLGKMPMSSPTMPSQPMQNGMSQGGVAPMQNEPIGVPMPGQVNRQPAGFEPPVLAYETPVETKERKKAEREEIKKYQQQSGAFSGAEASIDILESELPKFNTGWRGEERAEVGKFTEWAFGSDILGINPEAADNIKAAVSRLIQPLMALQAGNPSDKDLQFVIDSMPGLTTSKNAKKPVLEGAKALIVRYNEKTKAAKAYEQKFGTLNGFDDKWDNYVEKYRIITKDEKGNIILNKANIKNWREAVIDEQNPPSPPPPQPDMNDPHVQAVIARLKRG